MSVNYSVALTELVKEFSLEVVYASTDYESIRLTVEDVSRPGLQLAGYFDHFEPMRLQILGNVEVSYIQKETPQERAAIFDQFFSYKPPALLYARNFPVDPQCLEMARKHSITILRSGEATASLASNIIAYLRSALAPRITRHGVLVEVYGEGLLLVGDSGVGKSETALELLKRGHRLIADDAVDRHHQCGKALRHGCRAYRKRNQSGCQHRPLEHPGALRPAGAGRPVHRNSGGSGARQHHSGDGRP